MANKQIENGGGETRLQSLSSCEIWIRGLAPLVTIRNYEQNDEFAANCYISSSGWSGIPTSTFVDACVSVCRQLGFDITREKLYIEIEADGEDKDEKFPLVKILGSNPKCLEGIIALEQTHDGPVREAVKVPLWKNWGARLRIKYDENQFGAEDIKNLIARVGMQVGIGAFRIPWADGNEYANYGTFDVVSDEKSISDLKKSI